MAKKVKSQNQEYNIHIKCIKCGCEDIFYSIIVDESGKEKELYKCRSCGKEFNNKNRLGPSFNNLSPLLFNQKTAKLLLWCLAILFIIGSLYINHINGLKNENGTYYPYSIDNGIETTKDIFQIGEELYCDTKTLIVNKVSYPQTIDNYKPSDNMQFITLNVTIRNTTTEAKSYGPSDFKILLSNGEEVYSKYNSSKDSLSTDRIESNSTHGGNVNFEIPKGENNPILNYYCDYWIDELIAKVNLKNN